VAVSLSGGARYSRFISHTRRSLSKVSQTTAALPFKLECDREYITSGILSLRDVDKHLDASSGVGHN
jgi:hypothetical protein